MEPLHELAARIGLAATRQYGFALAGGYAVQAHGFLRRPSEDVDLFTVADARGQFDAAVTAAVDAYHAAGLKVDIIRSGETFARILLTSDDKRQVRVEMAVDWRAHPPVTLGIGAVLHQDDAVANKLAALYGRAADRDYVDIDAVLRSGRYSTVELLRLVEDADPGFDRMMFAQALLAVDRVPDNAFERHGLAPIEVSALRERIRAWAEELTTR